MHLYNLGPNQIDSFANGGAITTTAARAWRQTQREN
jgi:hypothetical protein